MKKTFVSAKFEVVKVQNTDIMAGSCQGQACIDEELCSGEAFGAKEALDLDEDF